MFLGRVSLRLYDSIPSKGVGPFFTKTVTAPLSVDSTISLNNWLISYLNQENDEMGLKELSYGAVLDISFRYSTYPRRDLDSSNAKRFFRVWAKSDYEMDLYISNLGIFRLHGNPSKAQANKLDRLKKRKKMALSEILEDVTETDDQTLNIDDLRPGAKNMIDSMEFATAVTQTNPKQSKTAALVEQCRKNLQLLFSSCSELSAISENPLRDVEMAYCRLRIDMYDQLDRYIEAVTQTPPPLDVRPLDTQTTFPIDPKFDFNQIDSE